MTLRAELSKNKQPRVLPLSPMLAALIERRSQARQIPAPDGTLSVTKFVFHRGGRPVGDFRKVWGRACEAVGLPDLIFHDLRRSAIRNFERAGVSQTVAMEASGHLTAQQSGRASRPVLIA